MSKFCGKCGGQIDEKTGMCPKCDADKLAEKKRKEAVGETYNQANTPDYHKPIKLTRKQKKAIKEANRTTIQKVRSVLIKVLAVLLAVLVLISGGSIFLAYNNLVEVPILRDVFSHSSNDNGKGKEKNYAFHPQKENITFDEKENMIVFDNTIIVYFSSDISQGEIDNIVSEIEGELVGNIQGSVKAIQIYFEDVSLSELKVKCDKLCKNDKVIYASIDYPISMNSFSDSNPWNKDSSKPESDRGNEETPKGKDWWAEAISAYSAWDDNEIKETVNIGIIDNGFSTNHEDLIGRINFPEEYNVNSEDNHGTHVAGIIGANNNTLGIRGICSEANLVCVDWSPVTNETDDENYTSYLSNGEYLNIINNMIQEKVKVINNSWGNYFYSERGYTKKLFEDDGSFDFFLLEQLAVHTQGAYESYVKYMETVSKHEAILSIISIAQIIESGYNDFIIVQAAGNGYDNSGPGVDTKYAGGYCGVASEIYNSMSDGTKKWLSDKGITFERIKKRILIVGAAENKKDNGKYKMTSFSNYGLSVDVCAPGKDIYSTITGNNYDNSNGTSMAAPIVTGCVGFLWSIEPNLSVEEIRESLLNVSSLKAVGVGNGSSYQYPFVNLKFSSDSVNNKSTTRVNVPTAERDVVLVLDASGSMDGAPLEETKKAAIKFVDAVLGQSANIGIVKYDSKAEVVSPFSTDGDALKSAISNIGTGGSTNIEDGLATAESMLSSSSANKKIIVLMSDGEPNNGKVGDELIAYANELKNKDTYIYTLGFFESITDKTNAQYLMEKIASDGCHYEVSDADSLVYFFGDIADQINGQKYIYVRIACPVDISVSYNGETLNSAESSLSTRTSFGSLTFEDADTQAIESYNSNTSSNQSDEGDDKVKILRLKEGEDYDIKIEGTGKGRMNYSIGFMDENGEYSDFRKFNNVKITRKTQIDTVAKVSDKTVLNVDEDGDGKYDLTYEARANSRGEIVDNSFIIKLILILLGVLVLLIIILIIYKKVQKSKIKKSRRDYNG